MDTAKQTPTNPIAELRNHMRAKGIRRPVERLATDCDVSATTVFNWLRDGYVTQLDHGIALVEASERYGLPMPIQRFRKPTVVIPFPTEPQRATVNKKGKRAASSTRSTSSAARTGTWSAPSTPAARVRAACSLDA